MAAVFALVVGCGLASILSALNADAMSQVFMSGFGMTERPTIWLVGWNGWILVILGAILLTSILATMLSEGQFSRKDLVRNLK